MVEPGIEHFLYVEDLELLVYITLLLALIIFLYGLYRAYRRWFRGERPPLNKLGKRVANLIKYGLLQWKVLYKPFAGTMHLLIYVGFIILGIGTLLRALEYDFYIRFLGSRFIVSNIYLIYKLLLNFGGIIAIIGLVIALLRRLFFKSDNLPNGSEDIGIILILLYLLVTGFILDGISTWAYRREWIGPYDPFGLLIAGLLDNYPWIISLYRIIWVTHMVLAIFMVAYLPYTKLFHIIAGGLLNTFFNRDYPSSAFRPIPNIDEMVEKGEIPGAKALEAFTWKQRMDYDACIKCARCTDNCPATISGKILSPMHVILDLREVMDAEDYSGEIVPKYIDAEVFWSCVTCGACVYQCPMLIHHVETIIDVRRYLLGKGEDVPEEALEPSYNIMRYGNPMGIDPMERETFIKELVDELGVEIASEEKEYDYIYWLGCQTSFDPNGRAIARSLIKILRDSGLKVAVLSEEGCCGEPIRRLGDELLFKELVATNGDMLSKYKFKYLLVNCPHGYNVFKHEYPGYGYSFNVIHHTELLNKLFDSGRVGIRKGDSSIVTYHDPCYLGRWNGIVEPPRKVINKLAGDHFKEMPRSRMNSFCCGGGGGHLFFEIKRGERISKIRMEEAKATGADIVLTACPYCKIMLTSESGGDIEVIDISEYIVRRSESGK